jgi:hypothetical protein
MLSQEGYFRALIGAVTLKHTASDAVLAFWEWISAP